MCHFCRASAQLSTSGIQLASSDVHVMRIPAFIVSPPPSCHSNTQVSCSCSSTFYSFKHMFTVVVADSLVIIKPRIIIRALCIAYRCSLFRQMSHAAWSVCLYVRWVHGWTLQKRLNQSRCCLGANLRGPKKPCIRWGRDPSGCQSTRHMTNSSHGQLVKKSTRHSQLVTRRTRHTVKSLHCISQLVTPSQATHHKLTHIIIIFTLLLHVCCIYANKDTGLYSSYVKHGVFSGVYTTIRKFNV